MQRTVGVLLGLSLLAAAACGGDDDGGSTLDGGSSDVVSAADDSSSPEDPVASGAPADTPQEVPTPEDETSQDTTRDDATSGGATSDTASIDGLAPGEAIVVVDGVVLRFARGDSIYDVCEMSPDFEFGDAQLDAVGFPPDGGPHLRVGIGVEPKYVVVGIPPDIGYVAGAGEEIDPYIDNFGIAPLPVTLEADDGFVVGTVDFTNAVTGDVVAGEIAVLCE